MYNRACLSNRRVREKLCHFTPRYLLFFLHLSCLSIGFSIDGESNGRTFSCLSPAACSMDGLTTASWPFSFLGD